MTKKRLYIIAECFRKAGVEYSRRSVYDDYPNGWCGIMSNSIGTWLKKKYPHKTILYICGNRKKDDVSFSHAWIKYRNIIIDVTANQFPDCKEPVIVRKERKQDFHSQFVVDASMSGKVKLSYPLLDKEKEIIAEASKLIRELGIK